MRQIGLIESLERTSSVSASPAASPANLLDDVARTLRDTVDKTAKTIDREQSVRLARAIASSVESAATLPQILQHPPRTTSFAATPVPAGPQMLAPAILAISLAVVGVLMSASIIDLSNLPGLAILKDKPQARLSLAASQSDPQVSIFDPAWLATAEPSERALLERSDELLAAGDIEAARQALANAANSGSGIARFALAETFDPIVLTAKGIRPDDADVGTARMLYKEVLAAGDERARQRLTALAAH